MPDVVLSDYLTLDEVSEYTGLDAGEILTLPQLYPVMHNNELLFHCRLVDSYIKCKLLEWGLSPQEYSNPRWEGYQNEVLCLSGDQRNV